MAMKDLPQQEFVYKFPGKIFGHVPGAHSGTALGSGDRFAGFADLFDYPDPRRLDIRASLKNQAADITQQAQQRWLVKRYQQRAAVNLWLLSDISESMSVSSVNHQRLAKLAHMIAHSAIGTGDKFAMTAFDSDWRQDMTIMPTTQRSIPHTAAERLMTAKKPAAAGSAGLIQASDLISNKRAMVFLASDFCFDLTILEQSLRKLSQYTIIPIVWRHDDVDHFPSHAGWAETRDAETGKRHSVWMRPSIKKRWQQQMDDHFNRLSACFMRYRIRPLYVEGDITPQQLTEYFYAMKHS
ncbi:MAG TPA: MxaS protein [Methylophaga aminisulfidivorans]|uniref:MxaS protein n=3 Tax=root TaxID=1 RepID=A0A7C1ZGB7_9GAMM|nr:MxaS protein [Methylophaga aminisulfidivorans]